MEEEKEKKMKGKRKRKLLHRNILNNERQLWQGE